MITTRELIIHENAIFATSLLILTTAAQAAEPKPVASPAPSGIETDPKTGAILFIVNGKEQARIDANGLHVRETVAESNGGFLSGDTTYPADPPDPKDKTQPSAPPPAPQATRIETDQKTGVIRFIAGGKEQAALGATGFHVKDDLTFGGTLTDGPTPSDYDPPKPVTGKGKP